MTNFTKPNSQRAKWFLCAGMLITGAVACVIGARWMVASRVNPGIPATRLSHYQFKSLCENPALPITVQQGGTCWCYAATSLIESEVIRLTGQRIKLSEAYFIRQAYYDKARHYIFRQGNSFFDEGADSHDVVLALGRHGMVPVDQYPGFVASSKTSNPNQMRNELAQQINPSIPIHEKHPNVWRRKFGDIMDRHLGVMPTEFEHEGRKCTPDKFRDALKINADEYVLISSFSHVPVYRPFVIEMLGNYSNFQAYNLPIDEWEENIQNAIQCGFTASFDCDVSEPFFLGNEGVAILPDREIRNGEAVREYLTECVVTQASRQEDFEASKTTDDHQLHAVGIAIDGNGTRYFKLKNSWGLQSGREGYVYMSSAYVRSKVLSVLLHRDGLNSESRTRLGLAEN